ncbi:unnamed protein product, partial [Rotaria sp. Silwood1]
TPEDVSMIMKFS